MPQRFDVETNIAPPLRKAITLVHMSGAVVYVAQPAFGLHVSQAKIEEIARRIALVLETP